MEQKSAEMRAVQSAAQWAERLVERKGNQSVALMVERKVLMRAGMKAVY